MTAVALVPALAAIFWLVRYSPQRAYRDVYLTALFLLPGWCRFIAPGMPDPTLHEAAILPIALVFFARSRGLWRFSAGDVLVLLLVVHTGYSEYTNAGYKEAQNLLFDLIVAGLFPYLLAKGLVRTHADRVEFAKRVVLLLAFLIVAQAFEFRFGVNPYRMVFDIFFPGQGDGWVTTFRYGLARAAGPFGHAILAGTVLLIGFSLQRWLAENGLWEQVNRSKAFSAALVAGLVMTMVRGPQIGVLIAMCVSAAGSGPNPRRRAYWIAVALVAVGIPAGIAAYSYASVGRAAAKTASQESAAYRKELIDKYVDIAWDHAALGWGRNGWPKVSGMPSIDNYYLLLALMHGVPATLLLLALIGAQFVRLLGKGFRCGPASPLNRSLSFRLAGMYAGFAFAILTVYMGDNVIPIFFTLTGFAEGFLIAPPGESGLELVGGVPQQAVAPPAFRVVLA